MDAATIITIALGFAGVVGAIGVAVFKAGKWHGEIIAEVKGLGRTIISQNEKIDENRAAITRIHERVDELWDRTPRPLAMKR